MLAFINPQGFLTALTILLVALLSGLALLASSGFLYAKCRRGPALACLIPGVILAGGTLAVIVSAFLG